MPVKRVTTPLSIADEAAVIQVIAQRLAHRNPAASERLRKLAQYLDGPMGGPSGGPSEMPLDLTDGGHGGGGHGGPGGQGGPGGSDGSGGKGAPPIESFVSPHAPQQEGTEHTATISWITFDDVTEVELMNDFMKYIASKGWKAVKFGWQSKGNKGGS